MFPCDIQMSQYILSMSCGFAPSNSVYPSLTMEDASQASSVHMSDESSVDSFNIIMDEMEEGHMHLLQMQAAMESDDLDDEGVVVAAAAISIAKDNEPQWGGSPKGKA